MALLEKLRAREIEIGLLLADGLSNDEIADRVHIKKKSVETIVSTLYLHYGIFGGRGKRVALALSIMEDQQIARLMGEN